MEAQAEKYSERKRGVRHMFPFYSGNQEEEKEK